MAADLLLRYSIITIAAHVACAWIQTFQSPWPLVDAFELADTAEEQVFKSLGVRFDGLPIILILLNLIISGRAMQCELNTKMMPRSEPKVTALIHGMSQSLLGCSTGTKCLSRT